MKKRDDMIAELVQWYMDCNGYTRSHPPVDDYIEEVSDMSDEELLEEYDYNFGDD